MGLKWKSVDFDKGTLAINHAVVETNVNSKVVLVEKDRMKNQSSLRVMPLLPEVKKLLLIEKENQIQNKKTYGNFYRISDMEYICVDELGVLVRPSTISSHLQIILKQNSLPKICFHELRHSCASLLISCGVSMKEVQEWLGHSTYSTTADIYSHLNYSSKLNIAGVLTDVFNDKKSINNIDKNINNKKADKTENDNDKEIADIERQLVKLKAFKKRKEMDDFDM